MEGHREERRDPPDALEDGSEGSDADASSDEHTDFEVKDVLGCRPEWTVDLSIPTISEGLTHEEGTHHETRKNTIERGRYDSCSDLSIRI